MLVNDGIRIHEVFTTMNQNKFVISAGGWTVPQMQAAYVVTPQGQGQWFVTAAANNAVNPTQTFYPIH